MRARGLALIFFIAPTSSPERIALVAERAQGFIYVVSVTGVTGARDTCRRSWPRSSRGSARTQTPLVLGFDQPAEQARQLNTLVDGFIVGARVRAAQSGVEAVRWLGDVAAPLDEA